MQIKIDVTDWNEEYQKKEVDLSTEEAIIKRAKEGVKPSEMGRLVTIAQEKGDMADGVISSHKIRLMKGSAMAVSSIIAKFKTQSNLKNGNKVNHRTFTCATEGANVDAVVDAESKAGLQNATNYLRNVVPGYIQGRLAIVAANNGDVRQLADELKTKIDEMVMRLE
jgi:hypothetical protein